MAAKTTPASQTKYGRDKQLIMLHFCTYKQTDIIILLLFDQSHADSQWAHPARAPPF